MNKLIYRSLFSSSLSSVVTKCNKIPLSSSLLSRHMAGGQQHLKKAINSDSNSSSNNSNTNNSLIIEAGKKNLSQSEWKLNFLVKLIRGAWVPGNHVINYLISLII